MQTVKDRDVREDERGDYARRDYLARGRGAVRGPLKTRGRKRGDGSESSYENSSGKDDEPYRQGNHKVTFAIQSVAHQLYLVLVSRV